jgi:hypothetical protein
MYEVKRLLFLLQADTPIAHHETSIGNMAVAMRRKVRQPDGSFVRVPYVTGDTARHGLREAGAYVFLDAAGLLEDAGLCEAALRLLFAGGMVTGRGTAGVVDMARYREICFLCPMLKLLGGCCDNRSIPGQLIADEISLVCAEQMHRVPERVREWLGTQEIASCREHLEVTQRVRMDPLLNPSKRELLLPAAQVEVSRRLGSSEKAHAEDDAVARDEAKSTMLPRSFERLVEGSLFWWEVTCHCHSELDVDTLMVMLGAFLTNCRVGGKKATGHGLLKCVKAWDMHVPRPAEQATEVDATALGTGVGSIFRKHVADHKEQVRTWVSSVNA